MEPTAVVHDLLKQENVQRVGRSFDTFETLACCSPLHCLQTGRKSLPPCIGNTCELVHNDVHATVFHGDGAEFGPYRPRLVLMYVSEWRPLVARRKEGPIMFFS